MNQKLGADSINLRVAIGAMIIKHMNDFSDGETVLHIQGNGYICNTHESFLSMATLKLY
ncbi:MAG: hypothetical protein KA536_11645 [Saprospiraceae bacterium]|jgi:hypothetical protein|nr:hypothetical protein [Saprospiraceae bacterium]